VNDKSVTWLVTRMGYGSSLLYWEPLLLGYCKHFPNTRILTSENKTFVQKGGPTVENIVTFRRLFSRNRRDSYPQGLIFVSPRSIIKVLRSPPDLLILSEFGLLTMYGVLASLVRPSMTILLLVETDPGRLAGARTRRMRAWMRRLICRRAARILTNNRAGERYLIEELRVLPGKIIRGAYLVSCPGFASEAIPPAASFPVAHSLGEYIAFLYVGQLIERKGVSDLVAAAALLSPEVRQRVRVWMVGDGDQATQLKTEIEAAGLQDTVCLFGAQPYRNLGLYYANADVFVMPAHQDYRALVGFEALAYGLPMIHSRGDGAVEEVVDEGRNGFAFPAGDVPTISLYMQWFVDNEHRLAEFRKRSMELSAQFSLAAAVDVLVDASIRALDE
jgi:glycosyltransferase involved in cell wall biosynthesis